MAEWLRREGCGVHFLASRFSAAVIRRGLRDTVTELGTDRAANRRVWSTVLEEFDPAAVVFADYPLLAFSSGSAPLLDDEWERSLDDCRAEIVTLDHVGYANGPRLVFFGPPHATIGIERIPPIPSRTHVLLPCPLHDPESRLRRGRPFRYWEMPPESPESDRIAERQRYVQSDNELLILHFVSGWALTAAKLLGNPYYSFLPRILRYYLGSLSRRVTVLSINDGALLPPIEDGSLRIVNIGPIDATQFERVVAASDLIATENGISVSLAKAICLRKPCVLLRNSLTITEVLDRAPAPLREVALEMERVRLGSVFPFEVFPIWSRDDVAALGVFHEDGVGRAYTPLEIFGGDETERQLLALLTEIPARARLRAAQTSYLRRIEDLPSPFEVLEGICAGC
jgi:hypothetical protein